jgi:hypothetical protein
MIQRVLLTFIVSVLIAIPASTQSPVVSREVIDFAHSVGCAPVSDFAHGPGTASAPYVYDWLPGGTNNSVVFWCKKFEKSERPYNLVFAVRSPSGIATPDAKKLEGCPAVIEYWNGPKSLSIDTRRSLELRYFRYVDMPKQLGPRIVVARAKVIVNDNHDGVTDTFYCYEGRWLVNIQH